MKTTTKALIARWNLALAACATFALGIVSAGAAVTTIVDETFDPPKLNPLFGYPDNPADTTRTYVSDGVGGSQAIQLSATLPQDVWGQAATILRQGGTIEGNNLATRANTTLSFDIKVDRPDLHQVTIVLESWSGYWWTGDPATSLGIIPLGRSRAGTFKHIVVPLDDPLWAQSDYPDPNNMLPHFDPSGKTYQIWLVVTTDELPTGDHFTATIDNVQVLTKTAMVPWQATGTGQMTWLLPAPYYVPDHLADTGTGTHVGAYVDRAQWTDPFQNPFADVELTAANGDKLFGHLRVTSALDAGVEIYGGTGRFQGAFGGYNITLAWDDEALTSYSSASEGCISTIGSKQK